MMELLEDNDPKVRSNTAKAIGKLGEQLIELLAKEEIDNADERSYILYNELIEEAIPALGKMLHMDQDTNVRIDTIQSLGMIKDTTAAITIQSALREGEIKQIRYEIIRTLGLMGEVAEEAVAALV